MADPFVGEIRIFPFSFAPFGWALCNGQILPISQNTALFALLGTQFGGNGTSNFALPNLQGAAPLFFGQGAGLSQYTIGQTAGEATHTLSVSEMPTHNHTVNCASGAANANNPVGKIWATAGTRGAGVNEYSATSGNGPVMNAAASGVAGSGNPHNNMPPFLALNFCIALQGIFPARS